MIKVDNSYILLDRQKAGQKQYAFDPSMRSIKIHTLGNPHYILYLLLHQFSDDVAHFKRKPVV